VFLLGKADLRILVLFQFSFDEIEWEGAQLFDTDNGNLWIELVILAFIEQVVVGFSRTENDLFHFLGLLASNALFRIDTFEDGAYEERERKSRIVWIMRSSFVYYQEAFRRTMNGIPVDVAMI
jgi:hypothetical protein